MGTLFFPCLLHHILSPCRKQNYRIHPCIHYLGGRVCFRFVFVTLQGPTTYATPLLVSIIHFDRYSAVPNFKCFSPIFSLDAADIGFMAT